MTRLPTDAAEALEPFRPYLMVLADLHLDRRVRGKLDPADLVQQAMLRGYAGWATLNHREPAVLAAWLRRILARQLADASRHFDADCRAVELERSLEADLDKSASGLASWLAVDQTSPSEKAMRNEELFRMAAALAELPDPQREVVSLRHLQGQTLQEIAEHTGKSLAAVAGLLRRGLEGLRESLGSQS